MDNKDNIPPVRLVSSQAEPNPDADILNKLDLIVLALEDRAGNIANSYSGRSQRLSGVAVTIAAASTLLIPRPPGTTLVVHPTFKKG